MTILNEYMRKILHRTTIMYFVIIRDSISKLKNLTNVIRSNAIIIFTLSFRLYVKSEKIVSR